MKSLNLVWAAVILASLAMALPAAAVTIWSDGFETVLPSNDFPDWTSHTGLWSVIASTQAAHSGLRGADIQGDTQPDTDMLCKMASTAGFQGLTLEYWYKVRNALEGSDWVAVKWTADGYLWQTLAIYENVAVGDWLVADFVLPVGAENNPLFGILIDANLNSTGDRVTLDDFKLTGVSIPEPITASLFLAGSLVLWRRQR